MKSLNTIYYSHFNKNQVTSSCSSDAVCNNTKGAFNCECKQGHKGDGYNCTGGVLFSSFALFFLQNRSYVHAWL